MDIKIRSEKISDYSQIACVNYEAFLGWHPDNPFVSEQVMVDLLRHNSLFDPDLSLVAVKDERIIGHAIFSPLKFVVLGKEQKGVVLGPIAVEPTFQRLGIGGMLIEEGHRRAFEKGFDFSLLCGHTDYYPRFGYRTKMFSLSGVKVSVDIKDFSIDGFEERPVNGGDIKWILKLWEEEHGKDNLALFPGDSICEWNNHGFECRSTVVQCNGRPLGYARYVKSNPLIIRELLAIDDGIPDLLAYLSWKHYGKAQGDIHISLPEEKVSKKVKESRDIRVFDEQIGHDAFMIKVLDENSITKEYCSRVEKGIIKPDIIVFPPMFDVDEGRAE